MVDTNKRFRPSEYFKPSSIAEAVDLLDRYGEKGHAISGGTDLMVDKDPKIEVLVDITGLGLDYIKSDGNGVRIGATTVFASIEFSPVLHKSCYYALTQAAHQMGTPQIRNVATIGGNICSAIPSADGALALLAIGASIKTAGPTGQRLIDIADFFRDVKKNALVRGELVTEIQLPSLPTNTETLFVKMGRVTVADLAVVNVAILLTITLDKVCQDACIALGAVAPVPIRAELAEAMLRREKIREELVAKAAAQAANETRPISDVRGSAEYRKAMSQVLVGRALKELIDKSFS